MTDTNAHVLETMTPTKLSTSEIRRSLRIATWEGSFGAIHANLVTSAFLTGFALAWGANDFLLGLLGAIPFLAAPGQLLGAYLVDRWANRRRETVALLGLLARGTWFLIALGPFVVGGSTTQKMVWVLFFFFVYQIAYHASGPGWVAWMAVLVPDRLRGRYLGRRNLVTETFSVVTVLAAGVAIDSFRSAGQERAGFGVLQVVAAATGIACYLLLRRQADPGHHAPNPSLRFSYLLRPLQDLSFRRLVIFNISWLFGLNVCTPFLNAHLLKNLHWDFKHLAALGVISSVAAILVSPFWGRLADRIGSQRVLTLCSLGMIHLPLYYLFCPWDTAWPIYVSNLLYGVFFSGFTLAMFSLTLGGLPVHARTMGSALLNGLAGPATFVSGALSGWLAEHLAGSHWQMGTLAIANYQVLCLLSVLLRVPTFFLLRRIQNPRREAQCR